MPHPSEVKTYRLVQYEQQGSTSTGISAGMWGVIETTERVVGFADDEAQARGVLAAFTNSNTR